MKIGELNVDGKVIEFEFITYGEDKKPVTVGTYSIPKNMARGMAKELVKRLNAWKT